MRIKFFAIYLAAGAAFLAVSLWVFLSKGKNAKAVRAKYKMGGIMLTASSLLAASSCQCSPTTVTCYEPVMPPEVTCYDVARELNVVTVSIKGKEGVEAKAGDVLLIGINVPTYPAYECKIEEDKDDNPTLIQCETFQAPVREEDSEIEDISFELTLSPGNFNGKARITLSGVIKDGEGSTFVEPLKGIFYIKVL